MKTTMTRHMIGALTWVCLGLGLIFANGSWGENAPGAQLDAFFQGIKTLSGRFTQTVLDTDGELLQQTRGGFRLLRPGRFVWSYEQPYVQQIVADGEYLWIYDQDLAQASQRPLDKALGAAPIMLLSEARPLAEEFLIVSDELRGGLHWIVLEPKVQDTDFTRIEMALAGDGQALKQMLLFDQFGQQTLIRFSVLQINPELPPADFRFQPPAGTDVIRPED